jgi:1-acyl-sn-glycerol-3-phosphate acyltransferase
MVNKCKEAIREGNSIMIFPEGTRSKDGNVQAFKTGAFRIALEMKAPILPIAIRGTSKAIRKGGLTIHKNHGMEIRVLDPLPYTIYSEDDQKRLAARVQRIISEQVSSGKENPVPPAHARQA